ncbi:MAG: DUF6144 family protein [Bacillota bacterium]|nr:DUF6144 family protein [Bacillota bacterium]
MDQKHNEARKLYENIKKHAGSAAAEKIAFGMDLPLSPTKAEKNEWVNFISMELEKSFDDGTIKKIRTGCHCTEKLDEAKEFIKNTFNYSNSLTDFVDKMNAYSVGWSIKDGYLITKYLSCPCPMLEGVDFLPTKAWCYCTVGYNKKIFQYVFDCEVDIELLESIKMGSNQCLMKIIPLGNINFPG